MQRCLPSRLQHAGTFVGDAWRNGSNAPAKTSESSKLDRNRRISGRSLSHQPRVRPGKWRGSEGIVRSQITGKPEVIRKLGARGRTAEVPPKSASGKSAAEIPPRATLKSGIETSEGWKPCGLGRPPRSACTKPRINNLAVQDLTGFRHTAITYDLGCSRQVS
jgi:hypothetical protein